MIVLFLAITAGCLFGYLYGLIFVWEKKRLLNNQNSVYMHYIFPTLKYVPIAFISALLYVRAGWVSVFLFLVGYAILFAYSLKEAKWDGH